MDKSVSCIINKTEKGSTIQNISDPEDVANVVSFIAREESGQITGMYLPVSGGAYLS